MLPTTTLLYDQRAAVFPASLCFQQSGSSEDGWSVSEARDYLERGWTDALSRVSSPPVTEMMSYALGGGKCLRGLLLLAAAEACGGSKANACGAAVSVEMVHAASLVVDDLPALDNAEERRSAPSLHKRFGECAAVLTSHALVAAAFELIAKAPSEPERLVRAVRLLACTIGARGMVKGELVGPAVSETRVRALKTGALFELAASMGALLAGAAEELAGELARLGLTFGVYYQIADDLRDEVMSECERESLLTENARNWSECEAAMESLRSRLAHPEPLERWMGEFRISDSEAGLP